MTPPRPYDTNLAAEVYVLASLHHLGLDASRTLGNKKSVDTTVVRAEGDVVTLDVKVSQVRTTGQQEISR
jgi:hypothetical protein